MELFILTFLVFGLAILGMAVGNLIRGRPLSGGCRRAGEALGAGISCGICGVEGRDGAPRRTRAQEFP